MSHRRILLFHTAVLIAIFSSLTPYVHAQQFEPPAEGTQDQARIVDGRPAFSSLKRSLHPFTWVHVGIKPMLRIAEARMQKLLVADPAPKQSGIKFSLDDAGSSSGFGPKVTPYSKNFLGTGIEFEMPLIVTYERYQSYRFIATLPIISNPEFRRLSFELNTGYHSHGADNFFGIGNDTPQSDRTRYRSLTREAGAAVNIGITRVWRTRIEAAHRNVGITKSYVSPSAQHVLVNEGIPGLRMGARILSTTIALERDTTNAAVMPSSGGLHRAEVTLNEGYGRGDFSYWKYRYEFHQMFPLSDDDRKVLTFRGTLEANEEKGGSQIPFFDLARIGGNNTVRGFRGYRFMDKSAVSAGVEYRYRVWRALDLGLFLDGGQVGPEIKDFKWDEFHTGYGFRIIGRSPGGNRAISFDVARSREAWKAYIDFATTF